MDAFDNGESGRTYSHGKFLGADEAITIAFSSLDAFDDTCNQSDSYRSPSWVLDRISDGQGLYVDGMQ